MLRIVSLLLVAACHAEARATVVTIPTASASSAPAHVAWNHAVFDKELHFKDGASGEAGGVAFTVHMLPKLILSGPQPEIEVERAQIDVSRGDEHAVLQLDTRATKSAEWSGVVFELGYADVYHDDVELTLHKK